MEMIRNKPLPVERHLKPVIKADLQEIVRPLMQVWDLLTCEEVTPDKLDFLSMTPGLQIVIASSIMRISRDKFS